ncbi:MAG: nucleotide exchange factor GrpE [Pseudonocardiaceae bacterium]
MHNQQPSGPEPPRQDVIGDLAHGDAVPDRTGSAAPALAGATPETTDPAVAAMEGRWRRTAADLDNLRKRYSRELDRERAAERKRVAAAFLPVLDNLELALTHAGSDPDPIVEGVRAVVGQMIAVFAGLGYARRDEVGVAFDPTRHEVVTVVDEPAVEPGTVVEVRRAGYGDGPDQLRPASVVVTRGAW